MGVSRPEPAANGAVLASSDLSLPFLVVDGEGMEVQAVSEFLRELMAGDCAPSTCRSYAFDLLRWFRLLAAVGVGWEHAGRGEVREMVVWLRTSENPQRHRSDPAALAAELESLIAPPATGRVPKGEQRRLGRPHRFSNHHQPRRRTPEEISEQSQDAQAGVLVKTRHSIVMESEDCFDLTGGAIPSANPDHFVRSFNPVPP